VRLSTEAMRLMAAGGHDPLGSSVALGRFPTLWRVRATQCRRLPGQNLCGFLSPTPALTDPGAIRLKNATEQNLKSSDFS